MTQIKTAHIQVPTSKAKYQPEIRRRYIKFNWQHNFVTLQAQLRVNELDAILTLPKNKVLTLDHLKRANNTIKDYKSFCKFHGVEDPLKGITHQ